MVETAYIGAPIAQRCEVAGSVERMEARHPVVLLRLPWAAVSAVGMGPDGLITISTAMRSVVPSPARRARPSAGDARDLLRDTGRHAH